MKIKFQIIISLLMIGCSNPSSLELVSNNTVRENFSKSEVEDLQTIFNFFNSQICKSEKLESVTLDECYNKYCSRIRLEQKSNGGYLPQVDFQKQLSMYKQINESTFNEIWSFQMSWKTKESDTLKYLSLNPNGKYQKFLKSYSIENKAIFNYSNSLEASYDMTPSMNADLIMDFESYDTSDLRTKLFIAIHYLTLNDQFKRVEKY